MKFASRGVLVVMVVAGVAASADAGRVYLSGNGGAEPWGVSNNVNAMDTAFGSGNWSRVDFSAGAGVLTNATDFLFIDGGDGTDGDFMSFLTANVSALESWVSNGGCLLMNAATWNYGSFALGFGATSNQAYDGGRSNGNAVNGAHPIFNGPNGASGTAFTGNYFAHNDITGGGFSSVMVDGLGRDILVERNWGAGYVMLGGLTTDNFHSGTDPAALRANMLDYVDSCPNVSVIPLPTGAGLAFAGMGILGFRRNRR